MGNTVGSYGKLTPTELNLIVWMILGDGHLEVLTSGSVRMSVAHGLQQKDYVDSLYHKLLRIIASPPKEMWCRDKRYTEKRPTYRFRTRCLPELKALHSKFYSQDGQKRIPNDIEHLLNPEVLAIWFMDDGSFKNDSRGLLLNTMSFSEEEQRYLQKILLYKFSIPTALHTLRRWKRIYISAHHSTRFVDMIGPYIFDSMRYKLQKFSVNPVTTDP